MEKSSAKILPIGSILFTSRAGIGNTAILGVEGATNQGFQSIVPNTKLLDSYFIYSRSRELKKYGEKTGAGTTFVEVSGKQMGKMPLLIPSIDEQKRIGIFFKQLDSLITLHQRKLELLKQNKKFLLQKMFPKNGEKIPEIRFSEFNKNWEQKKLGDVVKITMGQSPKSDNYTDNPEDYILVQGNADIKNNKVYPRVWTKQITKTANKGDIILTVRAPVGEVGKTDYDVVLGRGVSGIKGNNFIYYSLKKLNSNGYWTKYSTGSTFESINSNDIKNAIILISSEKEQKRIGEFFEKVDSLIILHQNKLEKLQNLKKFLLNKLFI